MDRLILPDAMMPSRKIARPSARVLYGTVHIALPLSVMLDGDTDPTPAVSCIGIPEVGVRVVMLLQARVLAAVAVVGGTAHAALAGLADDDHTQYLNAARHYADDHSTVGRILGGGGSTLTADTGSYSGGDVWLKTPIGAVQAGDIIQAHLVARSSLTTASAGILLSTSDSEDGAGPYDGLIDLLTNAGSGWAVSEAYEFSSDYAAVYMYARVYHATSAYLKAGSATERYTRLSYLLARPKA